MKREERKESRKKREKDEKKERQGEGGRKWRGNNKRRHPKRCNMMNTVSLGVGFLWWKRRKKVTLHRGENKRELSFTAS